MNVYDFSAVDNKQNEVHLSQYKGKVTLIVNTATGCGFTPQYKSLQALYEANQAKGFEILDFPCNQFLGQAPGSDDEIATFCQLNFGTTFPRFSKIEVNGENAHPLYRYLKEVAPQDQQDDALHAFVERMNSKGLGVEGAEIKWNFSKFLVDKEGNVVGRFGPTMKPEDLQPMLDKLLS